MSDDGDRKDLASVDSSEEPNVGEVLQKLSADRPAEVREMMAMMGSGPLSNPLHEKLNSEHITQVLELAASHDERQYKLHSQNQKDGKEDRTASRRYSFGGMVLVLAVFLILVATFKDSPNVLIPMITGFGGLVSGFIGGLGLGRSKD